MAGTGRGGNNAKPAAIRRLEGDRSHLGKRKFAASLKREPVAPGRPKCPDHLTPAQQQLWDATLRAAPPGLLCAADTALLEVFVSGWDLLREVNKQLATSELLVDGDRAKARNPLFILKRQAVSEVSSAASQLGMTPFARSRIVAPATEDQDPLALLLGWDENITGQRAKQ